MDDQTARPKYDTTKPRPPAPRRRSALRTIILWVVVLGVLGGGGYYAYEHIVAKKTAATGGRRNAAGGPPQAVGAATIGTGDIRVMLSQLGTVTPLATVTVKTQINGQLTQIAFTEGQIVHKGDFLAQIDPRPYQVALEQAEGTLAHDQALLKNAQLLDLIALQASWWRRTAWPVRPWTPRPRWCGSMRGLDQDRPGCWWIAPS